MDWVLLGSSLSGLAEVRNLGVERRAPRNQGITVAVARVGGRTGDQIGRGWRLCPCTGSGAADQWTERLSQMCPCLVFLPSSRGWILASVQVDSSGTVGSRKQMNAD